MTIRKGSMQSVTFVSSPPGARLTSDSGGATLTTPGQAQDLKRDHSHIALVEKDGYQPTTIILNRDVSMDVFQNFLCIGVFPICFGIDFLTDDAFEVKPDPVSVTLVPIPATGVPTPNVEPAHPATSAPLPAP